MSKLTPEKKVQNKIIAYIKELQSKGINIDYERRQAGGFNYQKGKPDLFIVLEGIHIEIEVKKPGGKTTPLQDKFAEKCKRMNCLYYLIDDVEYFKNLILNLIEMYSKSRL